MDSAGEDVAGAYRRDVNDTDATAEQRRVLLEILKREGFVSYDIRIRSVPNEGGNYLGELSEIDVRGQTSEGSSELNLFMKAALRGDKITLLSLNDVYKREMFTYTVLSDLYDGLQNEAGVPDGEKFKFVKAYGASRKGHDELLILENMARKGYTTSDRMKCVSEDFVERAIMTLAKFHSLSYVTKHSKSNEFRNITVDTLSTTAIKYDTDAWTQFVQNMEETVKGCVSTPDMVTRLNTFVKRMLEVFPGYHQPDERSVICHGDYRPNNMLVKEVNGKILDLLPIDFQLIYYGCPLNDFFYFVFVSTSREFRSKNLTRLKDLYREHMKGFLKHFDLNIESIYPRDEFENTFMKKLEYGLMVSIHFLPIILAPEDDVPKYGDKEISEVKIKSCSALEERMGGIIEDYVEFGLL